jgi:hypothetical protein
MIQIRKDNTQKNKYYAVTDKGVIYGTTPEIVQKKIDKLGAKEKIYMSDTEYRKQYFKNNDINIDIEELPF